MADPVLAEILKTEKAYVADMGVLCDTWILPLRAAQVLSKDEESAVFSNAEVIRGVNSQLLTALEPSEPAVEPVQGVASAFSKMAPFLRCYAEYCSNFVTAQETLDRMRAKSPKVEAAFQKAELASMMPVGSMLIKPVQRLCKYPLLFRELLHEIPDEHPHRALVLSAARTVTAVAAEVNEAVRCPPPLPPAPKPCPPHPRQPPNQSQTHSLPLHPPPYTLRPPPSTLPPPPSTLRPPPSGRCARRSDVTTS